MHQNTSYLTWTAIEGNPSMPASDRVIAWAYFEAHRQEINKAIRANEAA
jgi:hypothetical protein